MIFFKSLPQAEKEKREKKKEENSKRCEAFWEDLLLGEHKVADATPVVEEDEDP